MKELVISNKFIAKFVHKHEPTRIEFEFSIELESDIIEQAWNQYEITTGLKRFDEHFLHSIVPDVNMFEEINKSKTEKPIVKSKSLAAMITALTSCYSSRDDGSSQHQTVKRLARTRLINILDQEIEIQ